jgi:hypothetical protein
MKFKPELDKQPQVLNKACVIWLSTWLKLIKNIYNPAITGRHGGLPYLAL